MKQKNGTSGTQMIHMTTFFHSDIDWRNPISGAEINTRQMLLAIGMSYKLSEEKHRKEHQQQSSIQLNIAILWLLQNLKFKYVPI
jgi:hypothetical protein